MLWEIDRSMIRLSPDYVEPLFACASCHACTTACDHGVDVAGSLDRGRALAFEDGILPEPARRILRDQPAREAEARTRVRALGGVQVPGSGSRTVLFPGCSAALGDGSLISSAFRVVREVAGDSTTLWGERCCGLPHLQAGDVPGFVESARRFADDVRSVRTLVVLDPGCALALRKIFPAHGVDLPVDVTTVPELAMPHLRRFSRRTALAAPVFYHDPCHMGRGLGVYEPPREILLRLVPGGARDLHLSRESEPCCGGGGAIPETMPGAAAAIAGRLARHLRDQGAATVVTACPTCLTRLQGLEGLAAVDLVDLMARSL